MINPEDISNEDLANMLHNHTDWYEEYAEQITEGEQEAEEVSDEVALLRECARRLWELDNPHGTIDNPEHRNN